MGPAEVAAWRVRMLTALLLLAIFVAGGAAGFGLARWAGPRPGFGPPPAGIPGPPHLHLNELGLTPDQMKRAQEIFEKHRPEVEATIRETFPKVRAINDQIEREVREVLTPEQQQRLDRLEASRPPPPGPGQFGPPGPPPPPMQGPLPPPPGMPPPSP